MNKDVIFSIALELNPSDFLNLCKTSKKINDYICKNEFFWKNKIQKDFPNSEYFPENKTFKEIYQTLSNPISLLYTIVYEELDEDYIKWIIQEIPLSLEIGKNLPLEDLRNFIYDKLIEFQRSIPLYGEYTIDIDEYGMIYKSRKFFPRHAERIDYETTLIKVVFDSIEELTNEDYQKKLEEAFSFR